MKNVLSPNGIYRHKLDAYVNKRLRQICDKISFKRCENPDTLKKICEMYPFILVKLVRVRLSSLRPIVAEDPGIKIVWLVRDPRPVMNSRRTTVKWCTTDYCSQPRYHCHDMNENAESFNSLATEFPGRVRILRYEDLATDTDNRVKNLFDFVGLQMTSEVLKFVEEHTRKDVGLPWATVRKANEHHKEWINKTDWALIEETQTLCEPAMKMVGYKPLEKGSTTDDYYVKNMQDRIFI